MKKHIISVLLVAFLCVFAPFSYAANTVTAQELAPAVMEHNLSAEDMETMSDDYEYDEGGSGIAVVAALVLAIVISAVVTGNMKAAMKTARKQREASNYERAGSFVIRAQHDTFLYERTTSTPRRKGGDDD